MVAWISATNLWAGPGPANARISTGQTLLRQALHGPHDSAMLYCDLVLDNDVSPHVRQLYPGLAMELLRQVNPQLLVEREPLTRARKRA